MYSYKSLFPSAQYTPLEKLDKKHFAKGSRVPGHNGIAAAPQVSNLKEIAVTEAKINKLCELLEEVSIFCLQTHSCPFFFNHCASHGIRLFPLYLNLTF